MTDNNIVIKLEGGKLNAGAADALGPFAERIFTVSGTRIMAIIELQRAGSYEPDPSLGDDRKQPWVGLRTSLVEIVDPDDHDSDEALRKAQQALKLRRSAIGTLLEGGDVELSPTTLSQTAGILAAIEASKLRAGIKTVADNANAVLTGDVGVERLRDELQAVRDTLWSIARVVQEFDGDENDAGEDDPGQG